MEYFKLAEVFNELSSTTSRLEKTTILANFLKTINEQVIDACSLLLQGRVFPEWDSRTPGLAGKLVLKALSRASGYSENEVMKEFKKTGDIGDTAFNLIKTKKQQTLFSSALDLQDVFVTLQKLASLEGTKSQDQKFAELSRLLTNAKPSEAKFIVRTVLEDLRIGIAGGTLRDALIEAFLEKTPENKKLVKRALDLTADFSFIFKYVKEGKSLKNIKLNIGTPCKVMLARKERTFSDAFARTNLPARLEYKYDGFRLQVHKDGNKVMLFTRRLEEVTHQFPDIVASIQNQVTAQRCIIDGEAVGYDSQTGKYQPFQHISKRIRRKYDIEDLAKELPVELCIFDILVLEETTLLDKPLPIRLSALSKIIQEKEKYIVIAKGIEIKDEQAAQKFYEQSLAAGNEGIMIKDLKGTYQPGGRVSAWIKMKPIMDELDLVIVAAEWGNGKRSEWMTSFTLACQNEEGELREIGKVGTGFKEEESENAISFPQLTNLLRPLIIGEKEKEVRVKPEIVISIAYEEIQKSPTYSSGYALRFPRVLALRPDRAVYDIANFDDIIDLYDGQN